MSSPDRPLFVRPFVDAGGSEMPTGGKHVLRIMTYNLLAVEYCDASFFPYAEKKMLHWNVRSNRLFAEMLHYMSDIICVQVCALAILPLCLMSVIGTRRFTEIYGRLGKHGYLGMFKRRTGINAMDARYSTRDRYALRHVRPFCFRNLEDAGSCCFANYRLSTTNKQSTSHTVISRRSVRQHWRCGGV